MDTPQCKYLARNPKSSYKQLFIKDTKFRARHLYGQSVGEESRTPEQLAEDFDLPLEAVLEAIAYCKTDPPEIRQDWEREEAMIQAAAKWKIIPAQEIARINKL